MLKLLGRKTSSNVMKVIWLLNELDLPYERADLGGPFGGTGTPEYRAINPLGVVPSLLDDEFALFESNVILRYVCNRYAPTTTLYPQPLQPRATVESWMEFQQTALTRPQSILFQGLIRTAPEKRDHAAIGAATLEAAEIWGILDQRLASRAYVAGEEFSLADITFGVHVHRWFNMSFERPDAPHLFAWYQRLLTRPAYATHCAGAVV